jgi:hypothetical protein
MPDKIPWNYFIPLISQQKLTPIISSKLSNNYLLGDRNVAEAWAEEIEFPFTDSSSLARVAQYYSVKKKDENVAKVEYLDFLKEILYERAEAEPLADQRTYFLGMLRKELPRRTVSKVATRLGYPIFERESDDPLHILAQLPLRIYLTTSYHQFIEMALETVGKRPQTRAYNWKRLEVNNSPVLSPHLEVEPSEDRPLVYHVLGIDSVSDSLVLTEDNYFDFLEAVTEDLETAGNIPPSVRSALSSTSLLLLGYDLFAWDFMTVFRRVIRSLHNDLRPRSLAIQLDPEARVGIQDKRLVQVRNYLEEYFHVYHFNIYWMDVKMFSQDLWKHWE